MRPRPPLVLVEKLDCDHCQNPFVRQKFRVQLQLEELMKGSERGCQQCKVITDAVIHLFNIQVLDALKDDTIDMQVETTEDLLSRSDRDLEVGLEEVTIRIHVETGDTRSPHSHLDLYTGDLYFGRIQLYVADEPGKFKSLNLIAYNNKFLLRL